MKNAYKCIKSDPGNVLFEGQTVKPYYEDDTEIILAVKDMDHHIKKAGAYFADHLERIGGTIA